MPVPPVSTKISEDSETVFYIYFLICNKTKNKQLPISKLLALNFVAQSHTEDFPLGGSSLFIFRFFGNNMKIGGMNHEEKNRCAGNFILCDRGAYICGLCLKEPHGNKEL